MVQLFEKKIEMLKYFNSSLNMLDLTKISQEKNIINKRQKSYEIGQCIISQILRVFSDLLSQYGDYFLFLLGLALCVLQQSILLFFVLLIFSFLFLHQTGTSLPLFSLFPCSTDTPGHISQTTTKDQNRRWCIVTK